MVTLSIPDRILMSHGKLCVYRRVRIQFDRGIDALHDEMIAGIEVRDESSPHAQPVVHLDRAIDARYPEARAALIHFVGHANRNWIQVLVETGNGGREQNLPGIRLQ